MPKTKSSAEEIAIRIPSRLELLALLDTITTALCTRMEMDENTCSQITMAVIEAGTNAIQHAHHKDASKPVDIVYQMHPDRMEIHVHDQGPGFDASKVVGDITAPEHLFDARGRGIFIMRACMDTVNFEFTKSGTICHLVKHRPAAVEMA
jgi:anti-sigma regulatory factor (Ser/Thr protein kinase)